jgi:uncharacterized coiled-coil DUF342 family protein
MARNDDLEIYVNIRSTGYDIKRLKKIIRQLEFTQEHQTSPQGSELCCKAIKATTVFARYLEELLHAESNKG